MSKHPAHRSGIVVVIEEPHDPDELVRQCLRSAKEFWFLRPLIHDIKEPFFSLLKTGLLQRKMTVRITIPTSDNPHILRRIESLRGESAMNIAPASEFSRRHEEFIGELRKIYGLKGKEKQLPLYVREEQQAFPLNMFGDRDSLHVAIPWAHTLAYRGLQLDTSSNHPLGEAARQHFEKVWKDATERGEFSAWNTKRDDQPNSPPPPGEECLLRRKPYNAIIARKPAGVRATTLHQAP